MQPYDSYIRTNIPTGTLHGGQGELQETPLPTSDSSKYVKVVNLMKQQENVLGLAKYGSLHYEKLHGDKEGTSSVRINDQYRIEFTEGMEAGKQIATICNITDLSNHYK